MRCFLYFLCLFLLVACPAAKDAGSESEPKADQKAEQSVDLAAYAREHLFQPNQRGQYEVCFQKEQAYCIQDQALIDRVVKKQLGYFKRKPTARNADQFLKRVQSAFRNAIKDEAYWPALQERFQTRFETPVITQVKTRLLADYGLLPVPVKYEEHGGYRTVDKVVPGSDPFWTAGHLQQAYSALLKQYPEAQRFELQIAVLPHVGRSSLPQIYRYSYLRGGQYLLVDLKREGKRYYLPLPEGGIESLTSLELNLENYKACWTGTSKSDGVVYDKCPDAGPRS